MYPRQQICFKTDKFGGNKARVIRYKFSCVHEISVPNKKINKVRSFVNRKFYLENQHYKKILIHLVDKYHFHQQMVKLK
jgi:hypothetical protein